jgi:predicted nucleic acid-binding protein
LKVLVDSSVWVDFLKLGERGPAAALAALLRRRDVATCGPVVAELLAGTPPGRRVELWALMNGLPWVDLPRDGWRRVGDVVGDLLLAGFRVPLTDAAIAVAAVGGGAEVWSRDAHFDRIGERLTELRRFDPGAS